MFAWSVWMDGGWAVTDVTGRDADDGIQRFPGSSGTGVFFRLASARGGGAVVPIMANPDVSPNPTHQDISPELLDLLRCPVAVHFKDKGDDPGRLRLVRGCWLVCDDSGLKYPVVEGIPNMLVPEGEKWKDTAEADLPVPPPDPE